MDHDDGPGASRRRGAGRRGSPAPEPGLNMEHGTGPAATSMSPRRRALLDALGALSSDADLRTSLFRLVDATARATGSPVASLTVFGPEGSVLESVSVGSHEGESAAEAVRVPVRVRGVVAGHLLL